MSGQKSESQTTIPGTCKYGGSLGLHFLSSFEKLTSPSRWLYCWYLTLALQKRFSACVNISHPWSFPFFLDRSSQFQLLEVQLVPLGQWRFTSSRYLSICCSVPMWSVCQGSIRCYLVAVGGPGVCGSNFITCSRLQGTAGFFRQLSHHLQPSPCAHHPQHNDQPECLQCGSPHRVPGLLRAGLAHPFLPMPAQYCVWR